MEKTTTQQASKMFEEISNTLFDLDIRISKQLIKNVCILVCDDVLESLSIYAGYSNASQYWEQVKSEIQKK